MRYFSEFKNRRVWLAWLAIVTTHQRSCGKVLFSFRSVCSRGREFLHKIPSSLHTGSHDTGPWPWHSRICSNLFTLDLLVQGSTPRHVQTCLNWMSLYMALVLLPRRHFHTCSLWSTHFRKADDWHSTKMPSCFFTARKLSLRRLCFYRCLSVHRGACVAGGGAWMAGGHAWQGCAWQVACMAGGACMAGRGHTWQGGGMYGRGHAWHVYPPARYYEIWW